MRKNHLIPMIVAVSVFTGCKRPDVNSGAGTSSSAALQQQKGEFPTTYDLQEFYEIARASYLKKLRSFGEGGLSQAESELFEKFDINPKSSTQMVAFAETLFQLLESGRYSQKVHGVTRLEKVTRTAPKGLTDKDLEQFFQIVKMEYFKRITKRPTPEMDARESNFYARISGKAEAAHGSPDDVLLTSSDLFDKLEGVK